MMAGAVDEACEDLEKFIPGFSSLADSIKNSITKLCQTT